MTSAACVCMDDPSAADSARAIGANAYTAGEHIVFGQGPLCAADTRRPKRLLAHELTHVVQQAQGSVAERSNRRRISRSRVPLTRFERHAAANALAFDRRRAARHGSGGGCRHRRCLQGLQRGRQRRRLGRRGHHRWNCRSRFGRGRADFRYSRLAAAGQSGDDGRRHLAQYATDQRERPRPGRHSRELPGSRHRRADAHREAL